jgi:glutamate 5-kinase
VNGREGLAAARRLVVKIGSNALCHPSGELDLDVLRSLAEEIAALQEAGKQIVLVTSGAVKIGLHRLGAKRSDDLPTRQAAAAVGQSELIAAYHQAFARHGKPVAQILLTQNELSDFRRYLYLRNALTALLDRHGAVPIMNENDPVSAQWVEIGENDRLASLIASKIDADLLVLLSDVDGLYTGDPHNHSAELIPEVEKITPQLLGLADEADGRGGRGGMKAKLDAAVTATRAGIAVVIASSRTPHVLQRLVEGESVGTLFQPAAIRLKSRKRWIGFARLPKGKLTVDEGAAKAIIERGSSLLPVGVANVEGTFGAGDMVSVVDYRGKEIARGLTNYNSEQARLIRRCKTGEIEAKLGRRDYDEVIHRDNLVVM